jgi:2-alkyl-3-oxoalkanoate reductase
MGAEQGKLERTESRVGMKIFLTGATGVIGRRLVPILGAAGQRITAVARSPIARTHLQRQGVATVEVDLFDSAAVRRAVAGHDVVVNLVTHIPRSPLQMFLPSAWRENDRLRRVASATLVDAALAAGVTRFVQESFAPVYPDCGDRWIDETERIEPVRYNRTVADAEASATRFSQHGGSGIVLRFAGFYGPDAFQTVAMMQAIRRGWAPMPGPQNAFISSVSHDDAATAVAAALGLPPGNYNVVDDEPVTHREFFDSMAATLGVAPPRLPPPWITPLLGSLGKLAARSVRISNRKLRTACEWRPKYPSVRHGWPAVVAQMHASTASQYHAPASSGL